MSNDHVSACTGVFQAVQNEVSKVIVGQEYLVERLLVALIADGHVLLEGVPGLAKTKLLNTLTQVIGCHMHRVQFTPDLLPSDILGTEVYRPQNGDFAIRKGPVFTNLLLADEINRAPAKVQSALLQAMQERQVTIGETTFQLPDPFLVLATQNPIEQEGTYQLPEAQVDRFLMKLLVSYPQFEDELRILQVVTGEISTPSKITQILPLTQLKDLRRQSLNVFVDPRIDRYIVALVQATRNTSSLGLDGLVDWGASPRASLALKACARALAFIRGREFVSPDDVKELAPDILRHRILTSFEAEARSITSDAVIETLLGQVTVP